MLVGSNPKSSSVIRFVITLTTDSHKSKTRNLYLKKWEQYHLKWRKNIVVENSVSMRTAFLLHWGVFLSS